MEVDEMERERQIVIEREIVIERKRERDRDTYILRDRDPE